jgi:hypothetical protein
VLGTDCAIGKRTTATILARALNDRGVKAVMIGTGQTGLIQGARYGVPIDAIPSQFCAGELEATIINAFTVENPDAIIIEGQGALSHPAFSFFFNVVYSSWRLSRRRCIAACARAQDSLRFPGDDYANAGHGDKSHRNVRQDHCNWCDHKP